MSITTTYRALLGSDAALKNLGEMLVPMTIGDKIGTVLSVVAQKRENLVRLERALIRKHAKVNEETKAIVYDQFGRAILDAPLDYQDAYDDMLDTKVDLDCEQIPRSVYADKDKPDAKVAKSVDFMALDWLLDRAA